jgi:hypothetical protein
MTASGPGVYDLFIFAIVQSGTEKAMAEKPLDAMDAAREKVVDERTFIEFVYALAADRADEVAKERKHPSPPFGPGQNGWDNGTIEDFLYAAAQWAIDSDGAPLLPAKSANPWRRCADILASGKVYE